MKKLKSVVIKNFQSHKFSALEFSPGVNFIIGSSDKGKTSIIRAIRWAVYNKPSGTDFISYWGNATSVKLNFDDINITRIRSKKNNSYFLNKQELAGFGYEVPIEIEKAIDLSEINIQYQLDGPFLLGESPGAVARVLNKITSLDKIDIALSNAKSLNLEAKREIKFQEERIGQLKLELLEFPDFEKIDKKVELVEKDVLKIKKLKYNYEKLHELLEEIEENKKELEECKVPKIDFSKVDNLFKDLEKELFSYERISVLIELIEQEEEIYINIKKEREGCKKKLTLLCPSQCPMCGQPIDPRILLEDVESAENCKEKEKDGQNIAQRGAKKKVNVEDIVQKKRKTPMIKKII